jgi:hypothetical protein
VIAFVLACHKRKLAQNGGSLIFGYVDIQASYDEYKHLEFPAWLLLPLSIVYVLGIVGYAKKLNHNP